MKKFEFKTSSADIAPQTIEADDFNLDMQAGKLTFFDQANDQLAVFALGPGAYCKRSGK